MTDDEIKKEYEKYKDYSLDDLFYEIGKEISKDENKDSPFKYEARCPKCHKIFKWDGKDEIDNCPYCNERFNLSENPRK
jgi:rRNA maturation endonuclease Nob1